MVELQAGSFQPDLAAALEQRGPELDPAQAHAVATTGYVADELAARRLGRVVSVRSGPALREATIAFLREHPLDRRG